MARGQKLVGLRASSGTKTVLLRGWPITIAMEPAMEDTKGVKRPTVRNVCLTHHEPLKQNLTCPSQSDGCEPGKAVEYAGVWVQVNEEEWKELGNTTTTTIEIQAYIDKIDPIYVEKTYLCWPVEVFGRSYKLLLQTLEAQGGAVVGVDEGNHGTQRTFVVTYNEELGTLVAHLCYHEAQLRRSHAQIVKDALDGITTTTEEQEMLSTIINSLPDAFDMSEVRDTLGDAMWEYVEARHKDLPTPARTTEDAGRMESESDLMDTLRTVAKGVKPSKVKRSESITTAESARKSKKTPGAKGRG